MFSMFNTSNNENVNSSIGLCDASHFIMGKKILASLANQAFFQHIVDHDFRGSNIVMAMNEEILAYGKNYISLTTLIGSISRILI